MSRVTRKTSVVSISLDPQTVRELDELCRLTQRTRSSAVAGMIRKYLWKERWEKLREWGRESAKKLGITSEEDVYKLLGDA